MTRRNSVASIACSLSVATVLLFAMPLAAQPVSVGQDHRFDLQWFSMGSLPKRYLGSGMRFEGQIIGGETWIDAAGDNVLMLTSGNTCGGPDCSGKPNARLELRAYHYLVTKGQARLLWSIQDFQIGCADSPELNAFFLQSLEITDLNQDGLAESAFAYRMTCPETTSIVVKLLAHIGKKKYAIRGTVGAYDETGKSLSTFEPSIEDDLIKLGEPFASHWENQWVVFAKAAEREAGIIVPGLESPDDSTRDSPNAVMVGGDTDFDACGGVGHIQIASPAKESDVKVRAGPSESFAVVDSLPTGWIAWSCDSDPTGKWIGVVYSGGNNFVTDCGVSSPIRHRRPYSGLCSSGWIPAETFVCDAGGC